MSKFNNTLITNQVILDSVNKFWEELSIDKLSSDQYFNVLFKVYINNFESYKTIGYKFRVNRESKLIFIEYCQGCWDLKTDEYKSSLCSIISFAYRMIPLEYKVNTDNFPRIKAMDKNPVFKFSGYNLPLTMDLKKWGEVVIDDSIMNFVRIRSSKFEYNIKKFSDRNVVVVKVGDIELVSFIDYYLDYPNYDCFKRVIKDQQYVIKNYKIIFKQIKRNCKFIKNIKRDLIFKNNFITMDLETRTIDNIIRPYCVSIFDGKIIKSFFLTDYNNSPENLMIESVKYLMKRKYHTQRVYLHNFSKFDSIFMLNTLHKLSSDILKPNRRNGNLIDVKFSFENKYNIYFRDSYLLLPSSLRKLAISFGVDKKGDFPHKFLNNKEIDLNYSGNIPNLNYFYDLSEKDYKEYVKSFNNKSWILKKEAVKYCEQDVVTLHQIIELFNKKIFNNFRLNIHTYPTLPSLAFAIFRSNFLDSEKIKIPIILGKMYNYFQIGYTGGSVDVFKAFGEYLKRYDVNSLYAYSMRNNPMPLGNPIYFDGDIYKFIDNPFGVFKVKVIAPKEIKHPILQRRFKFKGVYSTISPVGSWEGVYFSEELKNALKYGYKFEVINGFIFTNKDKIFTEYIDQLYAWKTQSNKESPDYIIAKLLLNSLYGRFGMNPEFELHEIVDESRLLTIENSDDYVVTDITQLEDEMTWLSYMKKSSTDDELNYVNISIPIALAISSYSRIYMSQFKNQEKGNLYYTDTDSIDIDYEIDPALIGSGLGQLKLEHEFKEATFIAPKVYGGIGIKRDKGLVTYYEIVKAKGFKNPIEYSKLKSLLNQNSKLELCQEKWYRNFGNSEINVNNEIYTLMVTSNKRELVYNSNGQLVDTKPLIINENFSINENPEASKTEK